MLVGRQAEQQAIGRLAAAARLGASGVLAVTGEAGVGKSALLEQAVSSFVDMRILRARGAEAESEIPFAMLSQLLRPALAEIDAIPPAQAAALATALALRGRGESAAPTVPNEVTAPAVHTAQTDRFAIGAGVLSLICRYAEGGAVAVVVDDLQFADAPSVSALVFAARRLSADAVIVLLGVRSPEGDRSVEGLPGLALGGLDLESARELLAGSGVIGDGVAALHRATGGNPLAMIELSGTGAVPGAVDDGLPLHLPRTLADAFGRRIALLDDPARDVLLVAAVCGRDLGIVARACHELGLDPGRLAAAETVGLVTVHGGTVEFGHPLMRAAAYSAAPMPRRRAAHRAAAAVLPAGDVDRRAWHLSEAEWGPDASVADLLVEAGERAVARAAYATASAAFERAARRSPDDAQRQERLIRSADCAWLAGRGEEATALLDEADPAGGDGAVDLRGVELRASIAARSGSVLAARDELLIAADALSAAGRVDDAAIALADAVHAGFYLGDARTALGLADRLATIQPLLVDPRARALGLMATGMAGVLAGRGGTDEIRAAAPLLEDARFHRDPRRLSWLLLVPLFLRETGGGARLRELVAEVRDEAGIGALPAVLFHVARDESTTGDSWARAEADYGESIRLAAETGQTTELAMSLAGLAWLESRAGREESCRSHAARALELCRGRDIRIGEIWVGHALGDLDLALGRTESALARFVDLLALLERLGLDDVDLDPTPEVADALMRTGRHDEAAAAAASFVPRADAKGQPWARARAARAAGIAAADDAFDGWFDAALELHRDTPDRFETARTRLSYGERLRRVGRRVDAREQLRAAMDVFSVLGATVWADHAAVELTATGEHVRSRTADPLSMLTPQELQVSILLADGRTTREAAAALFLSPKTVEYHLRKVYTKLGIGSRAELTALIPH